MNHDRATKLLERYFDGDTTLQEEAQLKIFFQSQDLHPDLQPYAPLFRYWSKEAEVLAPARPAVRRRRLPRFLLAVAAALMLLLVARVAHQAQQPDISNFPVAERQAVDWSKHEITDEQEALRFVKSVLKGTSERMGEGPAITVRQLREVKEILD